MKFLREALELSDIEKKIEKYVESVLTDEFDISKYDKRLHKIAVKKLSTTIYVDKKYCDRYDFKPTDELSGELEEISSFLIVCHNHLVGDDAELKQIAIDAIKELFSISLISYMLRFANRSYSRFKKKANADSNDMSGTKKISSFSNIDYYLLTSQEAYEREGTLLRNCIGDHYKYSDDRDYDIYVAKKSETNESVAAIRVNVSDNRVVEAKGKNNKTPVEKYQHSIIDFLNDAGFKAGTIDVYQMNCINKDGKLIHLSDYFQDLYGGISALFKKCIVVDRPNNKEMHSYIDFKMLNDTLRDSGHEIYYNDHAMTYLMSKINFEFENFHNIKKVRSKGRTEKPDALVAKREGEYHLIDSYFLSFFGNHSFIEYCNNKEFHCGHITKEEIDRSEEFLDSLQGSINLPKIDFDKIRTAMDRRETNGSFDFSMKHGDIKIFDDCIDFYLKDRLVATAKLDSDMLTRHLSNDADGKLFDHAKCIDIVHIKHNNGDELLPLLRETFLKYNINMTDEVKHEVGLVINGDKDSPNREVCALPDESCKKLPSGGHFIDLSEMSNHSRSSAFGAIFNSKAMLVKEKRLIPDILRSDLNRTHKRSSVLNNKFIGSGAILFPSGVRNDGKYAISHVNGNIVSSVDYSSIEGHMTNQSWKNLGIAVSEAGLELSGELIHAMLSDTKSNEFVVIDGKEMPKVNAMSLLMKKNHEKERSFIKSTEARNSFLHIKPSHDGLAIMHAVIPKGKDIIKGHSIIFSCEFNGISIDVQLKETLSGDLYLTIDRDILSDKISNSFVRYYTTLVVFLNIKKLFSQQILNPSDVDRLYLCFSTNLILDTDISHLYDKESQEEYFSSLTPDDMNSAYFKLGVKSGIIHRNGMNKLFDGIPSIEQVEELVTRIN